MASVARREEKGSDVNVASYLLIDVLTNRVDAAIVISNESGPAYPIAQARSLVPLGLVNPKIGYLAGKLAGEHGDGVGEHWWRRLTDDDVRRAQLPERARHLRHPPAW